VERTIVGFSQDEAGDWIAGLACFHRQHVRHTPPFRTAAWVLDDTERSRRIGTVLDCPLCDRAELPEELAVVRTTATWDEQTMPAGLRRAHRLAAGSWGRLRVEQGELRFRAQTHPTLDIIVGADTAQAIPPEVEHEVEPRGPVRFFIEFLQPAE
jgi:tellurite resistance-related uncharacterized protein